MADPLLPPQGWVEGFAAQGCTIVFPFYWDTNGVGHAKRLAVILLRHSPWTEREDKEMQGTGDGPTELCLRSLFKK